MKDVEINSLYSCLCCSRQNLIELWNLPNLPLTGIYVNDNSSLDFPFLFDQVLMFCSNCSHIQLSNIIDSEFLYRDTYSHCTEQSQLSHLSNLNLLEVITKKFLNKNQILEIGCNDIFLLKKLKHIAKNLAGIDPIYDDYKQEIHPGIFVHGGFMESIDLDNLLDNPVDLVITSHTFEHLTNPRSALESLKPYLAKKFDFIIEIPSSLRMVDQLRLDQIFHQHVSYYSPDSISALLKVIDATLVEVTYNYGLWGGTQILHFTNYVECSEVKNFKLTYNDFSNSKAFFYNEIEAVKFKIEHAPGRVFAYGAAQMLPILQYHLGAPFDQIEAIFDDNIDRIGKFFPGDNRRIKSFKEFEFRSNDTVLITALDSTKPLVQNLINKKVNLIIVPLGNV